MVSEPTPAAADLRRLAPYLLGRARRGIVGSSRYAQKLRDVIRAAAAVCSSPRSHRLGRASHTASTTESAPLLLLLLPLLLLLLLLLLPLLLLLSLLPLLLLLLLSSLCLVLLVASASVKAWWPHAVPQC